MEYYLPFISAVTGVVSLIFLITLLFIVKQNKISSLQERLSDIEISLNTLQSLCTALDNSLKSELERNRRELNDSIKDFRTEFSSTILKFQENITAKFDSLIKDTHDTNIKNFSEIITILNTRLDALTQNIKAELIRQQDLISVNLKTIQENNESKLNEMRAVVEEKLQSTLEKRLTGSFELVNKQLEAVQKGLGEMQALASDVGGLKRALSNVKNTGTFGEIQLETILSDFLSAHQYEKNAHPNPSKPAKVVEFAIKIPTQDSEREFIYLPIDSKYPATVWDYLTSAYEEGDKEKIDTFRKQLETEIKKFAKDIKDKYIESPFTTDFAILFVPSESLYAEINRIPGLVQTLQSTLKITVSGPSTLSALLGSLQMGFRAVTIQKETGKVWHLLGAVKTEFNKFGDVLQKTKERLNAATREIENAETRSRQIEKKLNKIDTGSDEIEANV